MRRDGMGEDRGDRPFDPDSLRRHFDRPEVVTVYLFGSTAAGSAHRLSDLDLAYLGTSAEAEDRVFDVLYEALQGDLGEGSFDLVPLRRAPLHMQFAIATEGKPLLVRDPIRAEDFEARAITHYLDFKPHRDRYFGEEYLEVVAGRRKVEERIARIRRYQRDLEEFARTPREALRANRERQYAVLHAMQNAIEACIDIASHVVSADRLGAPADHAHLFALLEGNRVISSTVAESMRQMTRFRNRIVHLYWDVDLDLVHEYLTQRLGDFDAFLAAVEEYLGRSPA